MKIFQIVYSFANGGAEKFAVELSNELSQDNKVTLYTIKSIDRWMLAAKKISPQIKLIALNKKRKYDLSLFFLFFKEIKKRKPEIIHIHSSLLVFYLFILSPLFPKIKFIQTIHNTITPAYNKLFIFLNRFRFLNKQFINVCISNNILKNYRKSFPRLKFMQIDNGVKKIEFSPLIHNVKSEIEELKKNKNTKVFIAIGNYSDYKNFNLLIEVFSELKDSGYNVILLIIGGGKSANNKNFSIIAKEKSDNTYQLGLKSNIADYIFFSDVFIMSSTREGMPLVILEALSIGCPIISTPAGGIVDVIENGQNGFLTKDFSRKELIKVVKKFLTLNSDAIQIIKENNRKKYIENFSMKTCSANYVKLYSS